MAYPSIMAIFTYDTLDIKKYSGVAHDTGVFLVNKF